MTFAITPQVIASMAERRERRSFAVNGIIEANMNTDEPMDVAARMSDLFDSVLALRPHDIEMAAGLAEGLWDGTHHDRHIFLTNLQALLDAVSGPRRP